MLLSTLRVILRMLIGYSSNGELQLEGSGSGGVDEMRSVLKATNVQYGLLRATEKYDNTTRVFFCMVKWMGPEV